MTERIAMTIMGERLFSQHARPSDVGLPYAENAAVGVDMLRNGANRIQVEGMDLAREIKAELRKIGAIK